MTDSIKWTIPKAVLVIAILIGLAYEVINFTYGWMF